MEKEILKNMTVILTDESFLINSDGPLLASFIEHKKEDRLLDLCSGNGIIPIWLIDRGFYGEIVAIDIQKEAIVLLQETISLNSLKNISCQCSDLRKYSSPKKFDIVSSNPPYYDEDSNISSLKAKRRITRSSYCANIDDVVISAARNLKKEGSFYCCFPYWKLDDLTKALEKVKLYPKRLQRVRYNEKKEPWLVLVESSFSDNGLAEELPDIFVERDGIRNMEYSDIFSMGVENGRE